MMGSCNFCTWNSSQTSTFLCRLHTFLYLSYSTMKWRKSIFIFWKSIFFISLVKNCVDLCTHQNGKFKLIKEIISFRRETICDALAQTEWRNFVSKFFSSPQMHARWQHQIPHIPGGGGGHNLLFDAESKSVVKIFPFTKRSGLRIFSGGGGWGGGGKGS